MAIIRLGNAHRDKFLPYPTYAGGAVAAGDLVVQANDDAYYDACAADAVLVSGIAKNKAAAEGDVLLIEPIEADALYEMPYSGTPSATKIGTYVALDDAQTIDVDDAGHDVAILRSYDTTTTKCIVSFIPTCIQGSGVEN